MWDVGIMLRNYDIRPANIRFPNGTQAKGYTRADFADAWTRYCTPQTDAAGEPSQPRSERDGLPDEIVALLHKHRQEQENEKHLAAQLWHDEGWLFATPTGRPLNSNTDYHEWKQLLVRAGVGDGALHHARHTAATALLLLGVPDQTVMGLMGWSNSAMADRYQHVTERISRDVAKRLGGLLWDPLESSSGDAAGSPTAQRQGHQHEQ